MVTSEGVVGFDHLGDDAGRWCEVGLVHLQGNSVDGDTSGYEVGDQVVEPLALVRVELDLVLVDEQSGVRGCGAGDAEGVFDVPRPGDVVEKVVGKSAVENVEGFGDNVPSIHFAGITMQDLREVGSHCVVESCTIGDVCHVVGVAAA
jgi:hypothetical protein